MEDDHFRCALCVRDLSEVRCFTAAASVINGYGDASGGRCDILGYRIDLDTIIADEVWVIVFVRIDKLTAAADMLGGYWHVKKAGPSW